MENLVGYSEEEFIKRFENYCFELNDSLDMALFFNAHNFCDDDRVLIYEDFLEVYQCDLWVEGNEEEEGYRVEAPYFDENLFRIYPPRMDYDEVPYIRIEFIDYEEEIDIEERNEVMAEMKERFSFIFQNFGYIQFVSSHQLINWFFDDEDDEIFEIN